MVHIEPDRFDLIVLGTGLEESILAAAAAKAGRAVLHLDPSSHYGSAWGSFTTEQLIDWAQQAVQQQTVFEQQASEQLAHERAPEATTASSDDSGALYSNVQLYQQQEDLGPSRQYNIDLAAKAVFCTSEFIDTVLAFGVQNYLDFKLFQGSYLFSNGLYASVPASRSAVFRDRSLSPADKRLLTRFLMQLVGSANSNPFTQADPAKPLISLLKAEGLSAKLCLFILYAVAMANHDQETLEEQHICSQKQQSSTHSGSNAQASGTAQHASKHAHQSASQHNTAHAAKVGSLSTNGNEAQLPKQAHGGSSHTGSSTTSGQHSTAQDEQASSDSACAASAEAAVDSSQQQSNEASTEQQTPSDAQHQQAMPAQNSYSPAVATAKAELPEGLLSTEAGLRAIRQYLGSLGRHGPNTGALLTPMYGCAELPQAFCRVAAVNGALYILRQPVRKLLLDPHQQQCQGIETEGQQVIKCSAFAANSHLLAGLTKQSSVAQNSLQSTQALPQERTAAKHISRAICILDGPLQVDESQTLVVIPPHSLPNSNPSAICALQLGSAAAVCPADRTLLHLSTPSTAGHTAVEDLAAAVSALTNTSKLFQQSQGTELSQVSSSNSSNQPAQQAASGRRPAALLAVFFNQACQGHAEFPEGLPANVVACSAPDGSLDPDSAIKHAKESFAKLYPDDVSVFEPAHSSNPDADSDDEALDALSGVLQNLDPA